MSSAENQGTFACAIKYVGELLLSTTNHIKWVCERRKALSSRRDYSVVACVAS